MKTWNQELKTKFVEMARFRQKNRLFEQGEWLRKYISKTGVFCGCMHGSLTQLESDVVRQSSKEMQWPFWLSHLSEKMFEGLPPEQAILFPLQLILAVPCDTDISTVATKISVARLERLLKTQEHSTYINKQEVIDCLKEAVRLLNATSPSSEEWDAMQQAAKEASRRARAASDYFSAAHAHAAAASAPYSPVVVMNVRESSYSEEDWTDERDALLKCLGES